MENTNLIHKVNFFKKPILFYFNFKILWPWVTCVGNIRYDHTSQIQIEKPLQSSNKSINSTYFHLQQADIKKYTMTEWKG